MRLLSSPFRYRGEGYLGKIYRPYIVVHITAKKITEIIPVEMLVDTGADYTLFPQKYAGLLGINLERDCKTEKTYGVGGAEKIYLCKDKVELEIGVWKKIIPVGFLSRDDIPALLGRLNLLEALTLIMKEKKTILET